MAKGIAEAQELLASAVEVTDEPTYERWTHDVERWDARTTAALESVLNGSLPEEFQRAATGQIFQFIDQSKEETFRNRQRAIERGINTLRSIDERLEYLDEGEVPRTRTGRAWDRVETRNVFVVHGRDAGLRAQVARFLQRLRLEPIILDEQSDQGRTIIEKFEAHSLEVGYAVVLLSPDDYGRGPDEQAVSPRPNRARQNVILELGYFMGTLGRPRVAALHVPGTELPSDLHGLLYIPVDGAWETRLALQLKAAGMRVDLNDLVGG